VTRGVLEGNKAGIRQEGIKEIVTRTQELSGWGGEVVATRRAAASMHTMHKIRSSRETWRHDSGAERENHSDQTALGVRESQPAQLTVVVDGSCYGNSGKKVTMALVAIVQN